MTDKIVITKERYCKLNEADYNNDDLEEIWNCIAAAITNDTHLNEIIDMIVNDPRTGLN